MTSPLKLSFLLAAFLSASIFTGTSLLACNSCSKHNSNKKVTVKKEIKHISTRKLNKDIKKYIVVDARLNSKYDDKQRIPGAKAVSLKASDTEIRQALPDKSAAIVTYCGSKKCPMSKILAKKLRKLGYENVLEYSPGIAGWKDAGHKIVKAK